MSNRFWKAVAVASTTGTIVMGAALWSSSRADAGSNHATNAINYLKSARDEAKASKDARPVWTEVRDHIDAAIGALGPYAE